MTLNRDFQILAPYFGVVQKDKPDAETLSARGRNAAAIKKVRSLIARYPRIDVNTDSHSSYVTCDGIDPEDPADPLFDNHICVGGEEVLDAVQVYVAHLESKTI